MTWLAAWTLFLAQAQDDEKRLIDHIQAELANRDPGAAEAGLRELERSRPTERQLAYAIELLATYYLQRGPADAATPLLRRLCSEFPHLPSVQRLKPTIEKYAGIQFANIEIRRHEEGLVVDVETAMSRSRRQFTAYWLTGSAYEEWALGDRAEFPPLSKMEVALRWTVERQGGSFKKIPARKPGQLFVLEQLDAYSHLHAPEIPPLYSILAGQVPGGTRLAILDRKARPVPNAELLIQSDKERESLRTDAQGRAFTKITGHLQALVRTPLDAESVYWSSWLNQVPTSRLCLITDRPIYRPGDLVRYSIVVRSEQGRAFSFKAGQTVHVEIINGVTIARFEAPLDEFGTVSNELRLSDEPPMGSYSVYVDDRLAGGFRVEAYRTSDLIVRSRRDGNRLEIRVEYQFGGPVSGAHIQYGLYGGRTEAARKAIPPIPPTDPYYSLARPPRDPEFQRDGDAILEGEGRTDANGVLQFEIPGEQERSGMLLEATVNEPSGRTVEHLQIFRSQASSVRVAVHPDRNFYRAGDTLVARVSAAEENGAPVADEAVRLRLFERVGDEEFEQIASETGRTDTRGEAALSLKVPKEGTFRLKAEVRGSYDRATIASLSDMFVPPGAAAELIPDRPYYRPGDTVRLLLRGPRGPVHLAIDDPIVGGLRTISCDKGRTIIEVPLPADARGLIPISAMYFNKEEIAECSARIFVVAVPKILDVGILPDRSTYAPRDKARVEVRLRDSSGKPARARVVLAVVDESIFELPGVKPKEIRYPFYGSPEEGAVGFAAGVSFTLEEPQPKYGGGEEPRAWFPDTAYWRDSLVVDGSATVEVDLPDSITRWRVLAYAIDADTRVGQAQAKVACHKPLFVRVGTPRFAVERDRVELAVVVHSDEPEDVTTRVELEGARAAAPLEWKDRVEGSVVHRFTAEILDAGRLKISARASGSKSADAIEVRVPIRPHGIFESQVRSGTVEKEAKAVLEIPIDADRAELNVTVSHSLLAAIEDALPHLRQYPYGCVEQTMSRFVPSVAAMRALRELGLATEGSRLAQDLAGIVPMGLQKLYGYQHSDGGWGWWKDDDSDPRMSAYVVCGLVECARAGFFVSPQVLDRARSYLVEKDVEDPDLLAQLRYAWALLDPKAELDFNSDTVLNRSWRALALFETGRKEEAAEIARAVAKEAVDHHWSGVEETAVALRMVALCDPKNAILEPGAQWLLDQRVGPVWQNTLVTARSVLALVDVTRRAATKRPSKVKVVVDGKVLLEAELKPSEWGGRRAVQIAGEDLARGPHHVSVSVEGEPVRYHASVRYLLRSENLRPAHGELTVSRQYFRMLAKDRREPLENWSRVRPGDEILVQLSVRATREIPTVMVEDILPSGCEPKEALSENESVCCAQVLDDRALFALDEVGEEPIVLSYRVRAVTPGDFHVLPARAFNMYDERQSATSAEYFLEIRR
jgi:uncharacterized protein YfaS (alpha-2-macroglobulin family)